MEFAARKYRVIQEVVKVDDEKLVENLEKMLNLENGNSELSAAQMREIDKRLKHYSENPDELLNWNKVKSSW